MVSKTVTGRGYYFMWSLERVGVLYGLETFGNRNWYKWGSDVLLASQNAVQPKDIGVATASATFIRSIGGSFGVAVFGAIFSARLSAEVAKNLPPEVAAKMGNAGLGSL